MFSPRGIARLAACAIVCAAQAGRAADVEEDITLIQYFPVFDKQLGLGGADATSRIMG